MLKFNSHWNAFLLNLALAYSGAILLSEFNYSKHTLSYTHQSMQQNSIKQITDLKARFSTSMNYNESLLHCAQASYLSEIHLIPMAKMFQHIAFLKCMPNTERHD